MSTPKNRFRADFEIVRIDPDRVFLMDLDNGGRSVTNDAEWVVARVLRDHPGKRIIYRDSIGGWDELVHNGREFTGFTPYKEAGAPVEAVKSPAFRSSLSF